MLPSLDKLISNSSKLIPLVKDEFVELMVACIAFAFLQHKKKLSQEETYEGWLTFNKLNSTLRTALKLNKPLNVCRNNHSELEDELNELILGLQRLLDTGSTQVKDLFNAVKALTNRSEHNFSIPSELCQLGIGLLKDNTHDVYCPFEKGSDFAFYLDDSSDAFIETPRSDDVFYSKVQSLLLSKPIHIRETDPIRHPTLTTQGGLQQFNSVIAMLPLGQRIKNGIVRDIWNRFPEESFMAEVYYLRHMLAQSKGRVVCFVSNAFLFRTAAGERQLKQEIIENHWLESVIALPNGLFLHTSETISVLVIDKCKPSLTVKFFDARGDKFVRKISKTRNQLIGVEQVLEGFNKPNQEEVSYASLDEIDNNDYNLSPARYVKSNKQKKLDAYLANFKTAPLHELVDIIFPQAVKHDALGSSVFLEYGLQSLNEIGHTTESSRVLKVNKNQIKRAEKQKMRPGDVLVVCRGAVGKVGFAHPDVERNAIVNQAFAILRLKPRCRRTSSVGLFQYLSSEYGKYHLQILATGTTSKTLSNRDLSFLRVPTFDKEQQSVLAEKHKRVLDKQNEIDKLKNEVLSLKASAFQEI